MSALGARRAPPWRWLVIGGAALALLLAVERTALPDAGFVAAPAARAPMPGYPRDYHAALDRADIAVADARGRAVARGSEWLLQESLARRLLTRARLTGSFDEYAAAQAALDRAFVVAPPGAGPHMTQAVLDLTMHRLARASAMLDAVDAYAVPADAGERAEISAMRGDIAFYRGDYPRALAWYDRADATLPGTADLRRAVYALHSGDLDGAAKAFDRVEAAIGPTPQALATLTVQRGALELERGRWGEAEARFAHAAALFPGYWLVDEHVAELRALRGDRAGAAALYRDIVARTGSPEFIDALAALAARDGDKAAAARLRSKARTDWRQRLALFPEAASGHALDHCLAAADARCALALARANVAARPYGEARIGLARALLLAGRPAEADREIDRLFASPWRSAQLFAVASEVDAVRGRLLTAWYHRLRARMINPHVFASAVPPPSA